MSSPGRETPPTPSSPGGAQRPAGRYDPDSCEVSALPWDPVHIKSCVLTPRVESVSPQSCGASTHMPHQPSMPNATGLLLPMPGPQAGKPYMWLETLTPVGKPL